MREGTLSPDDAAELERAFHFGQWKALRGGWSFPGPVIHSSLEMFFNSETLIQCRNCCGDIGSDAGPGFKEVCQMALARFEFVQRAYDAGSDLKSGPLRLLVYPGTYPDEDPSAERTPSDLEAIDWPLSCSLDSLALPQEQLGPASTLSFGDAHLIEDEAGVAALRDARSEYLSGALGPTFSNMMVARPPGSNQRYAIYFRDVIPLENERGLVEPP